MKALLRSYGAVARRKSSIVVAPDRVSAYKEVLSWESTTVETEASRSVFFPEVAYGRPLAHVITHQVRSVELSTFMAGAGGSYARGRPADHNGKSALELYFSREGVTPTKVNLTVNPLNVDVHKRARHAA